MVTSDRIPMGRMHIDDDMREVTQRVLDSGAWIKGQNPKPSEKNGRNIVEHLQELLVVMAQ